MKKRYVILLILLILITATILSINKKSEYNIYKVDCIPKSLNESCDDKISIESINFSGVDFDKNSLNKIILNSRCNELIENTWGCGDYLVIYE